MTIKWRPAHVVMLHKFCDVKGCGLEMQEQEDQRPPINFSSNKPYIYQYRCPNGHVDSDKSLFPRWSVRSGLDPAIKKDECKCQS